MGIISLPCDFGKNRKKALDGLFCFVSKLFYVICFGVVEKLLWKVFSFCFVPWRKNGKLFWTYR